MIYTKKDLKEYLQADAIACARTSPKPRVFGDEAWKFQVALRKMEYQINRKKTWGLFHLPGRLLAQFRFHRLSVKLNFTIPPNVFEKGLSIPHYGTIVVAKAARVGRNCRIHEGVTIGATNGSSEAAVIGNNVFIGSGAKILGAVCIEDDVAIGANAVITRSITEPGTTWGGIPGRKISDRDSHSNLNPRLFT